MVFCNFKDGKYVIESKQGHNPYFNRWFSAIEIIMINRNNQNEVTILILIDGFLQ